MSRQAKFLLACFIGCVTLWLAYIGGLVGATVYACRTAENPGPWMALIWGLGTLIAAITLGLIGVLADEVRRYL